MGIKNIGLCNCEACNEDEVMVSLELFVEVPRDKLYDIIKSIDYIRDRWAEEGDWTVTLEQEKPLEKKSGTEALFQKLE